ncbi:MAG: TetR/AcrR family transcriptional regulator, partial [bacterium]|nr:TetR/AcrR family transcriptional regulator [bacterium]
ALKEFARYGFSGSRIERIAQSAKANKAMIFYYFSSKETLYQLVIKDVFDKMSPVIVELVASDPSPEEFLERVTEFYVGVYSQNPDFVRMMVLEMIQNPKALTVVIADLFQGGEGETGKTGPPQLFGLIRKWRAQGAITEDDPFQFMLNVFSLSLLSFIGKPFLEGIFRLSTGESPSGSKKDFKEKRTRSVIHLLKRGMLK